MVRGSSNAVKSPTAEQLFRDVPPSYVQGNDLIQGLVNEPEELIHVPSLTFGSSLTLIIQQVFVEVFRQRM